MSRIAIVTGGTRRLGAAISNALDANGCTVAAVYHGNSQAAEKFYGETGIATFKWDVSDFEACKVGIARVEDELGSVDILVNNAGIAKDEMLYHLSFEQWRVVIDANLESVFNMCRNVIVGMRALSVASPIFR